MALIQVRDVPDDIATALRSRAAEQGLTLAAFLRREFARIASTPGNAAIIERMAQRDRSSGPSRDEIVSEIRRLRRDS